MKKIIVIGAGAAGAKAASKAKRLEPNNHIELYSYEENIAYSRCGLPYYIEGSVDDIKKLIVRTPEEFLNNGIQVFLNHKLEEIYPEKKCVLINGNHIFYDELILALGASPIIPDIENVGAKNVFTLRNLEDGVEIKKIMEISKSVLIIGGGYIALELSEAFIKNGLDVTIVEINDRLASDFDEDFSKIIQNIVASKCREKINLYFSEEIVKFKVDENNRFKSAFSKSGKEFIADFCIISAGTRPNVEVARKAGIQIGITGAIYVDNKMKTNVENIFACGDCTQEYCIVTRQPVYIGLGTIANKEGRVAAINATSLAHYENFDGVLKSTITRFFDYTISKTGLTYQESIKYSNAINLEPIQATVTKKDKASYMPDANELTIKLVADKRSGELLGAQGIGSAGNVSARINTITSVLKSRLKVEELLHLDLPYSPPFSSSIDPILTAAYKLKDLMKK